MSKMDVLDYLKGVPSYMAVPFEDIRDNVLIERRYLEKEIALLKRKQMVSYFVIGNKCFFRGMMG